MRGWVVLVLSLLLLVALASGSTIEVTWVLVLGAVSQSLDRPIEDQAR